MWKILAIWHLMVFLVGCGYRPTTSAAPESLLTPTLQSAASQVPALISWNAETADQLIQALRQPELFPELAEPVRLEALSLALQEARWSFPQSLQAFDWYWLEAALQANSGSSAAATLFSELIATALRSGAVTPEYLVDWLSAREPQGTFSLSTHLLPPFSDDAALLEFSLTGQPAYFWIARPNDLYQVSLLASGSEFRPNSGAPVSLRWEDLTGDGFPEAWIIQPNLSQRIDLASLILYDLASGSAQRLQFSPALPMLPMDAWQVTTHDGAAAGLKIGLRLDGGSALCEYLLPVTYFPDGVIYRQAVIERPDFSSLVAAGLSDAQARLCLDLTVDWLRTKTSWSDRTSLRLLEVLMPGFPYGADATLYVGLYPPDELDRARFELGLKYARLGDLAGVQRWMLAILSQPSSEDSLWRVQAQAFLDAYLPDRDVRRACLLSQACLGTGRLNLNQLLDLLQPQDWADPVAYLHQSGVAVEQAGEMDFNQDSMPETWWLENTGGASSTVRILANSQGRPWLSSLDLPANAAPLEFHTLEPLLGQPVYRAQQGSDSMIFLYMQPNPEQAPAVWALQPYRTRVIQSWYRSLLQGQDLEEITAALETLQASPYFNCAQPGDLCQPSPQLAYLTGLYLERAGELHRAAEGYRQVEVAFPASAYAVLAHARLAP